MNVIKKFKGDNDNRLAWMQHDYYHAALCVIYKVVALALPDINLPRSYDHRTVQNSHDIFAAAFRYDFSQASGYEQIVEDEILGKTLYTNQEKSEPIIMDEWLNWLRKSLIDECIIHQLLCNVYQNQNRAEGYHFEDELEALILKKFDHIPWIFP